MKHFALMLQIILLILFANAACKHDVLLSDMDPISNPMDTTTTNSTDTTDPGMNDHLCDPDTIYFEKQVLPILAGNCAYSGCHDATTAEDDIILNSYANVVSTGRVVPFDLEESDLFEQIIETDPDKIMPPPPNPPLTSEQIDIISKWILQGAQNLNCEESASACDTLNISYQAFVVPLVQTYCQGCHNSTSASGGIVLEGYNNIKTYADNGKLYGAVARLSGFVAMPQGQEQLPDCDIDKLKSWIDDGAQNN